MVKKFLGVISCLLLAMLAKAQTEKTVTHVQQIWEAILTKPALVINGAPG